MLNVSQWMWQMRRLDTIETELKNKIPMMRVGFVSKPKVKEVLAMRRDIKRKLNQI